MRVEDRISRQGPTDLCSWAHHEKSIGGVSTIRFRMLEDATRIQLDPYANLTVEKIHLAAGEVFRRVGVTLLARIRRVGVRRCSGQRRRCVPGPLLTFLVAVLAY